MKKRFLVFFMALAMGISSGSVAMAATADNGDLQEQEVASARAVSCNGAFYINGKRYTCQTEFSWQKKKNTLYYAGIITNTKAKTQRVYSLKVVANTTHNGYKTYSGKKTTVSSKEDKQTTLVKIPEALDAVRYKGYTGSCTYSYRNSSEDSYEEKYTAHISAP